MQKTVMTLNSIHLCVYFLVFFFTEDNPKMMASNTAANVIQPAKTLGPILANVS